MEKKNFLFVSLTGLISDIAWQVSKEGHESSLLHRRKKRARHRNGKNFIYPINVNFEHKKLFPGDIGPSTGEMGTSMFWTGANQLFNQTLLKMEPVLALEGYVGYIDVN